MRRIRLLEAFYCRQAAGRRFYIRARQAAGQLSYFKGFYCRQAAGRRFYNLCKAGGGTPVLHLRSREDENALAGDRDRTVSCFHWTS